MFKSFALLCVALTISIASSRTHSEIAIIPKPQHLQINEGSYQLTAQAGIEYPNDARSKEIAAFLRDAIRAQTGIRLSDSPHAAGISLTIDPSLQNVEGYRLSVTPQGVTIQAATDRGLFWGVQTLRQIVPNSQRSSVEIPALQIDDSPAFAYRGFMLDVARHFYPVSFIKKQLDVLSYYKINTFHWHLTDDQGWRLQIKKYPKLTDVGAWRTEDDGSRYGGYYTQAEIRDVVEYARQRNILIIPEIEMPGHSLAALAAYPELSCTKQPMHVSNQWGVFKDIDCVGDENTFTFIQNVLDEVVDLFPSPYLHIGGDETPKDRWKLCASCQALMKEQGLPDEEGLQSYFIRRIQAYLKSKGKTLIGWDEILEGGADKDAIVEMWRGDDETRKALANGNRVIVAGPFYLDAPQDRLSVKTIYATDIVGENHDDFMQTHRAQILGGEAPLWSERANPLNAESKIYPRIIALAENLWSDQAHDDQAYADFDQRLHDQLAWLTTQHVGYGPKDRPLVSYAMSLDARTNTWQLKATRGFDDIENHYTVDGSPPTMSSPSFTDTITIQQPGVVKVTPYRNGVAYDVAKSFTLASDLALGKSLDFSSPVAPQYGTGDALVDGILGNDDFYDGRWVAWHNSDFRVTIDLSKPLPFHAIDVNFLMRPESRIFLPKTVYFFTSMDGQTWTPVNTYTPSPDFSSQLRIQHVGFTSAQPVTARYVRVNAERNTSWPVSFADNAHDTWLFVDEIQVH